MKISPIANGSAQGQPLNQAGHSNERLAAAKAAFEGSQVSMKPSDTPVDPQVERTQRNIRSLKMRTNVSPDRTTPEMLLNAMQGSTSDASTAASGSESAISDASEQASAAVEDTRPLSPQLAALAKQRRALQVKERELAVREKAITDAPPKNEGADALARLKAEPLSVLQEAGVTYDQLTEAILAEQSGVSPEIQKLKEEIRALKEGVDKNFTDRDAQAEQQVLAELRRDADRLAADGDTFEMIRATHSQPKVIDLIYQTYKQTGEILEVEEAMGLVEEELLSDSMKIASINKVKSKLVPTPQPTQQQLQPGMRTLTNRDNAKTQLSRRERALAAALGQLKK